MGCCLSKSQHKGDKTRNNHLDPIKSNSNSTNNNESGDGLDYNMGHKKRGTCIIFNHLKFDKKGTSDRQGTDVDRDKLEVLFGQLGFKVRVINDATRKEIFKELFAVSKQDHRNSDCFVCCILTHGEDNGVLEARDQEYKTSEIFQYFTDSSCASLVGKPKIFIIQACRGKGKDVGQEIRFMYTDIRKLRYIDDVDHDADHYDDIDEAKVNPESEEIFFEPAMIPDNKDFLIINSTMMGHYSCRNRGSGSWFIEIFVDVMQDYLKKGENDTDFLSLLTTVIKKVSYERESNLKELTKQVPNISHSLTKRIYLGIKK